MINTTNWEESKAFFETWWKGESTRPLIQVSAPLQGANPKSWSHQGKVRWGFLYQRSQPELAIRNYRALFEGTAHLGEAFPSMFINLGPGTQASYYTGYLEFNEQSETAWFEKDHQWEEIENFRFQEEGPWWEYTKRITRMVAEDTRKDYLGSIIDIGGVMDVVASLRGAQQLLMDLIEEPERVRALAKQVLADWLRVYDELDKILCETQEGRTTWMSLWCSGRWYPLQCDFSAMISPGMFEQFVLPELEAQAKWLDHSIYHLDGPGEIPHVDLITSIDEIDGIQWVPGAGNPTCESEKWFPLYEKILSRGKLLVLDAFEDKRVIFDMLKRFPKGQLAIRTGFESEREAGEFVERLRGIA